MAPNPQGTSNYHIPLHPFMPHTGGDYYSTGQGHGIYYDQTYMNQPFQGAWNQMAQRILSFLATLNFPDLLKLTNDPVSHDLMWLVVPSKIPSDILKFEGKSGEDPRDHVTTFHL